MQCTRAAIVSYEMETSPLSLDDSEIPQELPVTLALHAQVVRRLLTCRADNVQWPDVIAYPLTKRDEIPIWSEKATIVPDSGLWKQWHKQEREIDRTRKLWDRAIKNLMTVVPKKTLEALVELYVPDAGRDMARFGQQVDALFELPSNSDGLTRCVSVVETLSRWVHPDEMMDMAEQHYRLLVRAGEERAGLVEEISAHFDRLVAEVHDEFREESARGYCVPEEQYAFLGDTLFVFDGQYSDDEMRMLMNEYMADLQKRMTASAEERDLVRAEDEAENPARIPERVRTYVWRRDMGRCAVCGATEELEFDHIIPRSKGGASTVGNVQVICSKCNEKKSAQVARTPSARRQDKRDETLSLFEDDSEETA